MDLSKLTSAIPIWLFLSYFLVTDTLPAQHYFSNNLMDYDLNLTSLYASRGDFDLEEKEVNELIVKLETFKNKDLGHKSTLSDVLGIMQESRIRSAHMAIYGMLLRNIDDIPRNSDLLNRGRTIQSKVEGSVAFVEEAIRQMDREALLKWIANDPKLAIYKRRIHKILWKAPYTRSGAEQQIIEEADPWTKLGYAVYWNLLDGDICWPETTLPNGQKVTLNAATFETYRRSPDASLREAVLSTYLAFMDSRNKIFGTLLTERIRADGVLARQRGFENGMDALWYLRDGMPAKAYTAMIETVLDSLSVMNRYIQLKQKLLRKDHFNYYDFYAPLPAVEKKISVAQALDNTVNASAPFGEKYQKRLIEILGSKTIHMATADNKRRFYGIFPAVGNAHSYSVMNFDGDLASSSSLMGAATLMMAFENVPQKNRPDSGDDPGIYANSIIYLGNLLHDDYMMRQSNEKTERIAYLTNSLERIWSLFHRYVLVTQWEMEIEKLVADNSIPSGEQLSKMYLGLLKSYYSQIIIPREAAAEWMTFRVPFYSYEHQFWPAAMAGACAVYNQLSAGDPEALRIVDVLGRGDLDMTYPLFKQVGIDMTSAKTYMEVIKTMNHLMDRLEIEME